MLIKCYLKLGNPDEWIMNKMAIDDDFIEVILHAATAATIEDYVDYDKTAEAAAAIITTAASIADEVADEAAAAATAITKITDEEISDHHLHHHHLSSAGCSGSYGSRVHVALTVTMVTDESGDADVDAEANEINEGCSGSYGSRVHVALTVTMVTDESGDADVDAEANEINEEAHELPSALSTGRSTERLTALLGISNLVSPLLILTHMAGGVLLVFALQANIALSLGDTAVSYWGLTAACLLISYLCGQAADVGRKVPTIFYEKIYRAGCSRVEVLVIFKHMLGTMLLLAWNSYMACRHGHDKLCVVATLGGLCLLPYALLQSLEIPGKITDPELKEKLRDAAMYLLSFIRPRRKGAAQG
ncbi:hypothetical protein CEUSTIGMA_g3081.t1 [Chlamydomonas eustigma]|uniref:Uncharacterized protein n=1 Tax=Chlamydomonas eustigma TaxID=1157962 RepID=A0A250WXS8_9CHLO|nr:hypothetical protein CEUSTIGMA_g3081.t1 [Chlamydomonas eustigma]|eukprot:GAX75637.1 hypothetical protein CEUSTIGMA_g3081.t1 [Chlamydomonas eustigma]